MRRMNTIGIGLLSGAVLLLAVACSGSEERTGGDATDSVPPAESVVSDAAGSLPLAADAASRSQGAATEASKGSTTASASVDVLGRKIIRNGSLTLEVESVTDAYGEVTAIAARLGGYVAEGSYAGVGDRRTGRLVIRVPADNYDRAVGELQGVARNVTTASSATQDVTGEVTDLDAGLRNLRAVEAQYVALLTQARTIQDMLQVQERLQAVRSDIERTEARLALLTRLSDLATITVQLTPVPPVAVVHNDEPTPLGAAASAWDASLDTLRSVAVVGVAVIVYSWWLTPALAVIVYVVRRQLRHRRPAMVAPAS